MMRSSPFLPLEAAGAVRKAGDGPGRGVVDIERHLGSSRRVRNEFLEILVASRRALCGRRARRIPGEMRVVSARPEIPARKGRDHLRVLVVDVFVLGLAVR